MWGLGGLAGQQVSNLDRNSSQRQTFAYEMQEKNAWVLN